MNLLAAKIYYDGSHWIAIPHTERPYRQTYFVSDILDEDILCKTGDEEHGFKYILADNFTCISDGEIMGTVSPEVIEKMPKAN